jgi:hypothetical protein
VDDVAAEDVEHRVEVEGSTQRVLLDNGPTISQASARACQFRYRGHRSAIELRNACQLRNPG